MYVATNVQLLLSVYHLQTFVQHIRIYITVQKYILAMLKLLL